MKFYKQLSVLIITIAVCSCSSPSSVPKDSFYRISIGDKGLEKNLVIDGSVEVAPFSADGVIGERAIVYTKDGSALKQYSYHYWLKQPSVMFQEAMIDFLRKTGATKRAASSKLRIDSDYLIEGNIKELEHIIKPNKKPSIALEVEISLINKKDNTLKFINTFCVRKETAGDDVSSATTALRSALTDIFKLFVEEVKSK